MASSDKTELGLNKWSGTDKPKREDFNEDNRITNDEFQLLNLPMDQWTPRLIGGTTEGIFEYSTRTARAFKINKYLAFVYCQVGIGAIITPASGPLFISDLPYPAIGSVLSSGYARNFPMPSGYTQVGFSAVGNRVYCRAMGFNASNSANCDSSGLIVGTNFEVGGIYPISLT